jgi:hypothetical protein
MRTRVHVGFPKGMMPGSGTCLAGAFSACADMNSEAFNNRKAGD